MRLYLTALVITILLALAASAAQAACYAGYKAKRDDPLKLHYGVAELPEGACDKQSAAEALRPRLERGGWTLLNIVGTFDESQLQEKKAGAGEYFLRY